MRYPSFWPWLVVVVSFLLLGSMSAVGQKLKSKPKPKLLWAARDTYQQDVKIECDSVPVITLDFDCRCFEKGALEELNKLKVGDLYRVRILHINPLLYKISVGAKDTSTTAALPFPTFATLGLSTLPTEIASIITKAPAVDTKSTENLVDLFPNKK